MDECRRRDLMRELRWIVSRAAGRRPEMLAALQATLRLADVAAEAEAAAATPHLRRGPPRQFRRFPPAAG
jgi:hypothetical protein